MRSRILAGFAALVPMLASAPAPASVVLDFVPNLVFLTAEIQAGFLDPGGTSTAADVDAPPAVFGTAPDTTLSTAFTTTASLRPAASAEPKDIAEGALEAAFEFGAPFAGATSPLDRISFDINGTASAVDARNAAGNPSNAVVEGKASAEFFVDALFGGVSPGDVVGQIQLGDLRALAPFETALEINVFENSSPIPILTHGAGAAATAVQLRADNFYLVSLDYRMEVPFGNDPPFSFAIDIPLAPASSLPEPGSGLLVSLGMLLASAAVRRRRPSARRATG